MTSMLNGLVKESMSKRTDGKLKVKTKYATRCGYCREWIDKEKWVLWERGKRSYHLKCADKEQLPSKWIT